MTTALVALTLVSVLLVAVFAVCAVLLARRGYRRYGGLVVVWGAAFVGSDLSLALVMAGNLAPPIGRRSMLVLTLVTVVAQVLISRLLSRRWSELVLDSTMVSVGAVLLAWTGAVLVIGTEAADSTSAYLLQLCAAAFMLSVVCRQLRTLALPDRLGGQLLLGAVTLRCAAIAVCLFAGMGQKIPDNHEPSVVAAMLTLAVSYGLLMASVRRLRGYQPVPVGLASSRFSDNLPYAVVALASAVVLVGLAVEPGLRRTPFVAMCALLAVALCVRQVITSRANVELVTRLAEGERLYRSLVQDSGDVTMIASASGRLQYVSPAAQRVLGRPAEELVGGSAADVLAVPADELALASQRVVATGVAVRVESRPSHQVGVVLESVLSRQDDHLLISVRDVTERSEMREQLQHMAYHDELTGLPNWHRMHEEITAALTHSRSAGPMHDPALLFVDLDRFKTVNDAAGHAAGDAVLRMVADRLRAVIPRGAVLGRVGGDEFVVLLPGEQGGRRELVAHDIARAMSVPCETPYGSFAIGASVGIAPASGAIDATDLLRHADLAMYAAKRDFRPWQSYAPTLHEAAVARADRDRTFSEILDQRRLAVVFQPVVDIAAGQLVGCEALVRWRDPEDRLREPSGLLEYAERTGRMYDLAVWVLRAALDAAAPWWAAGTAWPVAVNLSSRDVLQPGLAALIRAELQQRSLPPAALSLEITEGVFVGDPTAAMAVCEELRGIGVIVAIDDFGTGFSSLAYLVNLPVDVLKVDKSFIRSLTKDSSSAIVVATIVRMAEELRLQVVAEGIETEDQRLLAMAAGVRYGQGYLFSGELPAEEMGQRMATAPTRVLRAPGAGAVVADDTSPSSAAGHAADRTR